MIILHNKINNFARKFKILTIYGTYLKYWYKHYCIPYTHITVFANQRLGKKSKFKIKINKL